MGDGGGRVFGGDRDKALSARRILVNHFRDDPAHQAVHAFNETTPRSSVGAYAYKDFLWRDATVPKGDLSSFRLSHLSPGPGYVYARSSWDEDATYFFFKCGDRFTAHQHLDVGHFLIYKHEELAGDGGHYDEFGTPHDVNYHLRTIAHSTILVHDPAETWPAIRAGERHRQRRRPAPQLAAPQRRRRRSRPVAAGPRALRHRRHAGVRGPGDVPSTSPATARGPTRRRSSRCFTRQIVFLRPGTFVIFDRVRRHEARVQEDLAAAGDEAAGWAGPTTWSSPTARAGCSSRRCCRRIRRCGLVSGADLYTYGGHSYPPSRNTGPAPECRIEVSPREPRATDYFLHVLTATGADVADVREARPPPSATDQVRGRDLAP